MLKSLEITLLFALCCFTNKVIAQFDTNNSAASARQAMQENEGPELDSISVHYFFLSDIYDRHEYSDTSISLFSHAVDPSRNQNTEYFNLGNAGSAAYPIIYNKEIIAGTNYGYQIYDIYRLSKRRFRYYEVNRPFFDFMFSPVSGQQNFILRTDFARSFSDGVSLSLNYDRINQEGFYTSQDVIHTNFGLGFWYHHPNGKRDLFVTFKNEVNTENHNGGVVSREAFSDAFADERMSIGVNISSAATRFQHRSYEILHIHRFQDTLSKNIGWALKSTLDLNTGYYKYADESVSQDQSYYGEFYVDDRGIRNFLGYTRIHTSHHLIGTIFKGFNGNVGIDFTHHALDQDVRSGSRNDIFLEGALNLPLSNSINVVSSVKAGLGSSTGEFIVNGKSSIALPSKIKVEIDASFYRNRHPLIARSLYVSGENIWENTLSRPFGSYLKSKLKFPLLDLSIGYRQSVENNTLFWDSSSRPIIYDGVYTSSVIDLEFSLKAWNFQLHNYFAGQVFSINLFNLPKYYGKSQLFWQGKLFRDNMELRLGIEGRLIGPHNRINYNPLIAVFYAGDPLDREEIYPHADAFLVARIKQFRFFLRFENLGSLINDKIYFQIGDYPQYDRKIRLGIKWHLYD